MLLRRVIDHVKVQNWTAIALDFVIVVSGVFLGIQVANWNAAQADIGRGEKYVQRLIVDLENDLHYRRSLLAYYDAVTESAERTVVLLSTNSSDDTALVVSAYRTTEYNYFPQTRATWDEIVSSGDLGLLPDKALQNGLILYFGDDAPGQVMDDTKNSPLRVRIRSIIAHSVQKAIRNGCSDVTNEDGNAVGFSTECRLGVSGDAIASAAAALRNDPELLPNLRLHFSTLNNARVGMQGDIVILERVIAILSYEE